MLNSHWLLFVDRAGSLASTEPIVMAGLLMPGARPASAKGALSNVLDRACPALAYPQPLRITDDALGLAAAALGSAAAAFTLKPAVVLVASSTVLRGVRDKVLAAPQVGALASDAFAAEVEQSRAGFDVVAGSGPGSVTESVEAERNAMRARLRRGFLELRTKVACTLLGACEGPIRDARVGGEARVTALFEILLERLIAILGNEPDRTHTVYVRSASWPEDGCALNAAKLTALAERIRASAPTTANVQFGFDLPATFDGRVHPGLVLAQHAAAQLRNTLLAVGSPLADERASPRLDPTWPDVVRGVARRLGLPVEVSPARASTVSALRPAPTVASAEKRDAVSLALAGRLKLAAEALALSHWPRNLEPPWSWGQALRWLEILGGTR